MIYNVWLHFSAVTIDNKLSTDSFLFLSVCFNATLSGPFGAKTDLGEAIRAVETDCGLKYIQEEESLQVAVQVDFHCISSRAPDLSCVQEESAHNLAI